MESNYAKNYFSFYINTYESIHVYSYSKNRSNGSELFSRHTDILDLSKFIDFAELKVTLSPFPNKSWFLRACCTSLLKTLWEKEKLLVMSNFSFSHLFGRVFYHFHQI